MTEPRSEIWDNYIAQGGMNHRIVKRMFLDYERYHEAGLIQKCLDALGEDLNNISIFDYGCGVGDYGIHLLRSGAKSVDFYDFPRSVKLVQYRLDREKLNNSKIIDADADSHPDFLKYNMIIFGEVLEHLDNPAEILALCISCRVKYIFTTSYPYRSENPNDSYWSNPDHGEKARLQIPDCKKLLEDHYDFIKFDGELRLWQLK